jgi:COMPASS component SWD3
VKFWDITSGLCIKTISSHLGEVTSVEMNPQGSMLLSSSKDNSIRLWDIRMIRPVRRFKGHQNTSKNFVRAGFAHPHMVFSGSEDGVIHIWNEQGQHLQRLVGHEGTVYQASWNSKVSKWISCSDDMTVKLWWTNPETLNGR